MFGKVVWIDADRIGRDLNRDPVAVSSMLSLLLSSLPVCPAGPIPDDALAIARRAPCWPQVKAQLRPSQGGLWFHGRHLTDREPRVSSGLELRDLDDLPALVLAALPRRGR